MPYEYRKLSPQEREETVNYRRERGYPLHAPPHPFRDAGAYLISAANFEHKALMKSPERRTEFEMQLLTTLHEIADDVIAWVVCKIIIISLSMFKRWIIFQPRSSSYMA